MRSLAQYAHQKLQIICKYSFLTKPCGEGKIATKLKSSYAFGIIDLLMPSVAEGIYGTIAELVYAVVSKTTSFVWIRLPLVPPIIKHNMLCAMCK